MITPHQLEAARRGQRQAQRLLYDAFAAQVFGVCRRYASDYAEAEDFAQDAWLHAFAKLGDCREAAGLGGWLRRVAVTTCLMALRRRRVAVDGAAAEALARGDTPLPEGLHVAPEVLSRMSAAEIVAYVAALPDGFRAVFNLVAVEGYSHAEAAEALGITPASSRSQLTRARASLRARLTRTLVA